MMPCGHVGRSPCTEPASRCWIRERLLFVVCEVHYSQGPIRAQASIPWEVLKDLPTSYLRSVSVEEALVLYVLVS